MAYGERWRPYRSVASWYLWRAADMKALPIAAASPKKTAVKAPTEPRPSQKNSKKAGLSTLLRSAKDDKTGRPTKKIPAKTKAVKARLS